MVSLLNSCKCQPMSLTHLSNIITCDISKNKCSEHAKTATVRPVFNKDDRTKIKTMRLKVF